MSDTLKKPTEIKLDWIFYDGDFYSIEKCIKIKICFKLKQIIIFWRTYENTNYEFRRYR